MFCEIKEICFEIYDKTLVSNQNLPFLFCCKEASKTAVFIAFCTVSTTIFDVFDVCLVK